MAIESILAQIDEEIAKLTQIRALLVNSGTVAKKLAEPKAAKKKPGRPKGSGKKRRVLSPEARKKIADAQRKRWAAQKAE